MKQEKTKKEDGESFLDEKNECKQTNKTNICTVRERARKEGINMIQTNVSNSEGYNMVR